jgi:hypothetical protein
MKKWLFFFLTFALLIIICFSSYLYFYRADFLSIALTRLYGTPVKVSKVHLSKHGIKLQNVILYNPTEFTLQPALTAVAIEVKMDLSELPACLIGYRPVVIHKLNVIDPHFGIEMQNAHGTQNNWVVLLNRIVKNCGPAQSGRTFLIESATLRDVTVEIRHRAVSKATKRPPQIDRIDLSEIKHMPAMNMSQVLFLTSKLALRQIGEKLGLTEFAQSIEAVPAEGS